MRRPADIFISHASEDKSDFVSPLARELRSEGLDVWYDDYELVPGDSLWGQISEGLTNCLCGLVVLSPHFFEKRWTHRELAGLAGRMVEQGFRVIPVLNNMTPQQLLQKDAMLANLLAIRGTTPLNVAKDVARIYWGAVAPQFDETIANTGIREFDEMLRGGFRHPTSIALVGPRASGRSTLAARIQEAALRKSLPGLYITYSQSPVAVIQLWNRLNIDALEFAKRGLLRVFDPFSAMHGISQDTLMTALPAEWRPFVEYVAHPDDPEQYISHQLAVMAELGGGGVNVIDSVNARYELLGPARGSMYFSRMKNEVSLMGGVTAIHIIDSATLDQDGIRNIANAQDSMLRIDPVEGHQNRFRLTIDFLSSGPSSVSVRQFALGRAGIIPIPDE